MTIIEQLNNPAIISLATAIVTLVGAKIVDIFVNKYKTRDNLDLKKFDDNANQRKEDIEEMRNLRKDVREAHDLIDGLDKKYREELAALRKERDEWISKYWDLYRQFTDFKAQREGRRQVVDKKIEEAKSELHGKVDEKLDAIKNPISADVDKTGDKN